MGEQGENGMGGGRSLRREGGRREKRGREEGEEGEKKRKEGGRWVKREMGERNTLSARPLIDNSNFSEHLCNMTKEHILYT